MDWTLCYRWKIACVSGLTAAALALLCAQVISHLWARERPFQAHPAQTLLLAPPSSDASLPSDHAGAAFAVAFSVALVGGRRLGALFLGAATIVALTRVFAGLHYPGDAAGGTLIGFVATVAVYLAGRNRRSPIVGALSRVTDPLTTRSWQALDAVRRRRRDSNPRRG